MQCQQSFGKIVRPSLKELGLTDLLSVYSELSELGKIPVIIDAADLQQDPEPLYAAFVKTWISFSSRKAKPFHFSLYGLLEQSLPFYNMLRCHLQNSSSLLKTPLLEPDLQVPANKKLFAWVGDEILCCNDAKVSVFDSTVQGGDSVWEGLRVYNGKIFNLEEHYRIFDSAKALAFNNAPTCKELRV